MAAPRSPRGLCDEEPVLRADLGAHLAQTLDVQVDRARADLVAARHRDPRATGAGEQRAQHGGRGAHAPHELVGRLHRRELRCIDRDRAALPCDARAEVLEHLAHRQAVLDVRHVAQHRSPRRQQRRGHQLEGGVLGARDPDRAGASRPSRDQESFHGAHSVGGSGRRRGTDAQLPTVLSAIRARAFFSSPRIAATSASANCVSWFCSCSSSSATLDLAASTSMSPASSA